MNDFFEQAKARLKEESGMKLDRYGEAMKASVKEALLDFAGQEEEFAQAVVQGGSFKDCMAAVGKRVKGNAISDLEAYKAAVEFYFPGAKIRVQMSIDLIGDAAGTDNAGSAPSGGGIVLNLRDFL